MSQGLITGLYASIFGLLYIYFGLRVVFYRRSKLQDIGDGGHADLARAIRVHQNAGEYAPLFFIMLMAFELTSPSGWLLHALGGTFIGARVLHFIGFGLKRGKSRGRTWGTVLTYLLILTLALINAWAYVHAL